MPATRVQLLANQANKISNIILLEDRSQNALHILDIARDLVMAFASVPYSVLQNSGDANNESSQRTHAPAARVRAYSSRQSVEDRAALRASPARLRAGDKAAPSLHRTRDISAASRRTLTVGCQLVPALLSDARAGAVGLPGGGAPWRSPLEASLLSTCVPRARRHSCGAEGERMLRQPHLP